MHTNRPQRLEGVSYIGFRRYFLTICTAFRARIFEEEDFVGEVHRQLQQCAAQFAFEVTAYCFMPDHLHVLVTATSEQSDFCELVRRFKQVSAFRHKKSTGGLLWQPGYHERILRDDEMTEAVVRYILENPIRGGLSQELGKYPFAGSDVYDLAGLMTAWENAEARG
jgi:putative transposase